MSTIIAYKDQGFSAVSVVTKRTNGSLVTPDSTPLCEFFRVDPATGSMVKDLNVGTLGSINLSLVAGSSFLYSGAVNLAQTNFELYAITVTYSYDSAAGTNVERLTLIVSTPLSIIYQNREVTSSSPGTTYKAPPTFLGP